MSWHGKRKSACGLSGLTPTLSALHETLVLVVVLLFCSEATLIDGVAGSRGQRTLSSIHVSLYPRAVGLYSQLLLLRGNES